MLTKEQVNIFEVFKKNLFKGITFSDMKKELKESSNSKLQRAILTFKEEDLISIDKIGKTNLLFLNFKNNKVFHYLSLFNLEFFQRKNPDFYMENFYKIQNCVMDFTEFFSFVLFHGKNSNLNCWIIIDDPKIKEKISLKIQTLDKKITKGLNINVIDRQEFLKIIKEDHGELIKEFIKEHFVFYGLINFYNLILKEVGESRKY